MNSSVAYALIMLIAGLGIPIMAALNSSLGVKLHSPLLAVTILLAVGLLISLVALFVTQELPQNVQLKSIPWYLFCGGVFVIFYLLSITWVAPKFGVANAVSFVLLGQLIAMTIIDHFGFVGAPQYLITHQRILGLLLMSVGVVMVVNRASNA